MYKHDDGATPSPHLDDHAKVMYTASDDYTVRQWNLKHPDDWRLAMDRDPKTLRPGRSPIHEGREDYVFGGHSGGVSCIVITDGKDGGTPGVIYTASWDQSVRVWDRDGALDNLAHRAAAQVSAGPRRRRRGPVWQPAAAQSFLPV